MLPSCYFLSSRFLTGGETEDARRRFGRASQKVKLIAMSAPKW